MDQKVFLKNTKMIKKRKPTIAFYAGSFDPFTNGHLGVVKQAVEIFDEVIIGIGTNSAKKRRFDKNHMKTAIEATLTQEGLTNVFVVIYDNLLVDAALAYETTHLVRGLRNAKDYQEESQLAQINKHLSGGIQTVFLPSDEKEEELISSSLVKELLNYGHDVSMYLPTEVTKEVYRFRE